MPKKKTGTQLNREIDMALHKRNVAVLRQARTDPAYHEPAIDALLERGYSLKRAKKAIKPYRRFIRYELINYDVWGNENDGFEVNNKFRTGQFVEIPDGAGDDEIVQILKANGIIKKTARTKSIEIDGDGGDDLYFSHAPTGRPEFELSAVDEK